MSYRIVHDRPAWVGPWVCAQTDGLWTPEDSTTIGLATATGELVAGTIYSNFNGRSLCMHTAIQRMNREFLWYCFHYPFIELGVTKVLGLVDSFNIPAINLDRHLGFIQEGEIKDAAPRGNLLIFSMTAEQCRWLNAAKRPGVHHGWKEQGPQNARLCQCSPSNGAG